MTTDPQYTHEQTQQLWYKCSTFHQICNLYVDYFNNILPYCPTYNGCTNTETQSILSYIIQLTRSYNILPLLSQPYVSNNEYNIHTCKYNTPQYTFIQCYCNIDIYNSIKQAYNSLSQQLQDSIHICCIALNTYEQCSNSLCLHNQTIDCNIVVTKTKRSLTCQDMLNNKHKSLYKSLYIVGSNLHISNQLNGFDNSCNKLLYNDIVDNYYSITIVDTNSNNDNTNNNRMWEWLIDILC